MSLNGRIAHLERDLQVLVRGSEPAPTLPAEPMRHADIVDICERIRLREAVAELQRLGIEVPAEFSTTLAGDTLERRVIDEHEFVNWADLQLIRGLGASRLSDYRARARAFVPWAMVIDEILENTPEECSKFERTSRPTYSTARFLCASPTTVH